MKKNVISSKMLWNFPDKLKREIFPIVSAACPENQVKKIQFFSSKKSRYVGYIQVSYPKIRW